MELGAFAEDRAECLRAGTNFHLTKPVSRVSLRRVIEESSQATLVQPVPGLGRSFLLLGKHSLLYNFTTLL